MSKLIPYIFLFALCVVVCGNKAHHHKNGAAAASIRYVKKGLQYPWEILWGSDDHIWMTEREGRISRIDPATGTTVFSYQIKEVESRNEGGLLGMALDPGFSENGYLYVVYNYRDKLGHKEKLVRFTYAGNALMNPFVLIDGIKGSTNHNGSRLWVTHEPDPKIFMTTGDAFNSDLSQGVEHLNGKILRINVDGTIPSDSPFPGNPVWSYGHRNPQGLVMVNNILYASEHGASREDEINIIEKGRNYGWPEVEGPCNANESDFCRKHQVKEPAWSSGNNTLAVCGLDYYNSSQIPQWKHSLLMVTLKNRSIQQLKLAADDKTIIRMSTYFEGTWGRLRDLCISPEGKVYVCTSNGGNDDMIIEISAL